MMCLLDSCHPLLVDTVPLTSSCASWARPLCEPWASLMFCLEPWIIQKPLGKAKCLLLLTLGACSGIILRSGLEARSHFNSPQFPCSGWLAACLTPALCPERLQVGWHCWQVHVLRLFSTPLSTLAWASGTQPSSYINACPWVSGAKHRAEGAHHCPMDFIIQGSL